MSSLRVYEPYMLQSKGNGQIITLCTLIVSSSTGLKPVSHLGFLTSGSHFTIMCKCSSASDRRLNIM